MGVVLNRVHPAPPGGLPPVDELAAALAGAADPLGLAERAEAATLAERRCWACATSTPPRACASAIDGTTVITVPAFAREPVELEGIAEVAAALGR